MADSSWRYGNLNGAKLVDGAPRSRHPLYATWSNMRQRCNCKTHPDYQWYGARGIKVCARWDDFENFARDMGPRPEGFTLDRRDNEGDYSPENCRWATPVEQVQSQRTRCTNTTGVSGVTQDKHGGYVVRATINGVRMYLGYVWSLSEAEALLRQFGAPVKRRQVC